MADGYARASGRFGAALGIGGPGLCNMTTAVAAAKTDSSPVLILSGEIPVDMEGLGEFQDASQATLDDTAVMKPLTRLSTTVASARNLNHWLRHGLTAMLAQPSGPVHLSLTHDTLMARLRGGVRSGLRFLHARRAAQPTGGRACLGPARRHKAHRDPGRRRRRARFGRRRIEGRRRALVHPGRDDACARRASFRKTTNSRSACSAMPAPGMRPRRCSIRSLSSCSSSARASTSATPCIGRCARDRSRGGFTSIPTCGRSPRTASQTMRCPEVAAPFWSFSATRPARRRRRFRKARPSGNLSSPR